MKQKPFDLKKELTAKTQNFCAKSAMVYDEKFFFASLADPLRPGGYIKILR